MSSIGSFAELSLFRLDGDAFCGEDGTAVSDCPTVLSDLLAYWRSRCQGQTFPARADIDPIDIPSLLEHLLLLDVLRDPLDFRYRLVGGHIVEHTGRNLQGRAFRDLIAGGSPQEQILHGRAMEAGETVAEVQVPVYIDLTYGSTAANTRKRLLGLLLPLGESGADMNMVLGGLHYVE
jgi:hypothetical protein